MSHCYSVPMLASLSHKLASFLLTHWFAVQELSSSVHAGAAAVWKKGNIQFYGTIAILKNHLKNVLKIFHLRKKKDVNKQNHCQSIIPVSYMQWI